MLSQVLNKSLFRSSSMLLRPVLVVQPSRFFAAAAPKEELSITQLHQIGYQNLNQTKVFDYNSFAMPHTHGQTNQRDTFISFEDQINSQF
jgi:hypothetical protein